MASFEELIKGLSWKREFLPHSARYEDDYVYKTNAGLSFRIHQGKVDPSVSGEIFGTTIWDSSIVLSKGKRLIEVGAGTGLVGLVAYSLGADVTLTDYSEAVLKLLKKILHTNHIPEDKISVQQLVWGEKTDLEPFDIIVGADVMYGDDLSTVCLVKTLEDLSTASTDIYMAYGRNRSQLEHFLALIEGKFSYVEIAASDFDKTYRCPDVNVIKLAKIQLPPPPSRSPSEAQSQQPAQSKSKKRKRTAISVEGTSSSANLSQPIKPSQPSKKKLKK
eukprot:TRINITY_DN3867_c0_g1_i3.p1 TRINITY_DN3867_c0_g1~~TRINITY_DN3867_c0_g1_i3.p1  ORF type:complete len:289 (-),score=54.29 TRINITY_DN3867_c0_g1_i3:9-836(-)